MYNNTIGEEEMGMSGELIRAKLVRREDVTPDLCRLWFRIVDPVTGQTAPFPFKPGQYCTLGINEIKRPYSIVSAPHEPELEIFVELMPEPELEPGEKLPLPKLLTPLIWKLNEGDSMSIRPRTKGRFLLHERVHHHFMVATVTGVAPYISMIRNFLHHGGTGHKFYVLLGASYMDELTYDGELAELAQKHPDWLMFVPTVSRPDEERNAGWQGAKGRVNLIAEDYLEEFKLPQDDTLVYTCGHPGMIEDIKKRLKPKGWKIQEERFWPE